MNILQQQIFILHSNLLETIPYSEIIATQIGPDTENREHFKMQIYSWIQYWVTLTWRAPATPLISNMPLYKSLPFPMLCLCNILLIVQSDRNSHSFTVWHAYYDNGWQFTKRHKSSPDSVIRLAARWKTNLKGWIKKDSLHTEKFYVNFIASLKGQIKKYLNTVKLCREIFSHLEQAWRVKSTKSLHTEQLCREMLCHI